ncbi:hypothetical protein Acr_00g0034680 [Actinidia rufa]|uniref:Uncharacterized protein n=1 Tax=Actinidia rufa TaxID=165716 RepID=A0A7J0DGJ6_9ERIC|nr:hypothetical protein Acr_00g0034680 [Actinidia rufa]
MPHAPEAPTTPNLASDLAIEVEKKKIHTHLAQRVEAMRKSRELLFTEALQLPSIETRGIEEQIGENE